MPHCKTLRSAVYTSILTQAIMYFRLMSMGSVLNKSERGTERNS
jgi:hypothetical protein